MGGGGVNGENIEIMRKERENNERKIVNMKKVNRGEKMIMLENTYDIPPERRALFLSNHVA